jgi:hypothetical protein
VDESGRIIRAGAGTAKGTKSSYAGQTKDVEFAFGACDTPQLSPQAL